MKTLSDNKTYIALKNKANDGSKRMPSIKKIHELLDLMDVEHWFYESVNVVEYRTGGNTYVNSRHSGKVGYEIKFRAYAKDVSKSPFYDFGEKSESKWFDLDSSDSYYSFNSYRYAVDLITLLDNVDNFTFRVK